MTRVVLTSSLVLLIFIHAESKIFAPCELGAELAKSKYNVSFWQIPTWVCLAHHATGYNSSYNQVGYVGIFRLSASHWCNVCGVTCDKLTDDDIEDDINCAVNVVYRQHHGTLDGFSAWGTYYSYCREPWKDLQAHECHKMWNLLVLKLPKPGRYLDYDATSESSSEIESSSMTDYPGSTTESTVTEEPGSFANWEAHHVIFSDTGLLIIILVLILVVAGIIEVWRRNELPLAQFCMNA